MSVEDYQNKLTTRAFALLPGKVQKKIARTELRKVAKVLQAKVKQEAPVETKQLKAKIKVRAQKKKRRSVGIIVGVDGTDFGTPFNPKAAIQEYGSRAKNIPEKLYMSKSFDEKVGELERKLQDALDKTIQEEFRKS